MIGLGIAPGPSEALAGPPHEVLLLQSMRLPSGGARESKWGPALPTYVRNTKGVVSDVRLSGS